MESPDLKEDLPERIERDFYPTRWTRLGNVGLSLGCGGFSAFAASVLLGRGELIGVAFAPIAAWGGWMAFRWYLRWRRGGAAISLTEDGILDGTGLGAPIFISWADITSVYGGDGSTTIKLRGDARRRVPLQRRLLGWLTRKSGDEYVLPTRLLDTDHRAVDSFIADWHESLLLEKVKEDQARIPRSKVDRYLLCVDHPAGAARARHFEARGYLRDAPERFEQDLLKVGRTGRLTVESRSEWCTKWVLVGTLNAPDGAPISIATEWIVHSMNDLELLTAYPLEGRDA